MDDLRATPRPLRTATATRALLLLLLLAGLACEQGSDGEPQPTSAPTAGAPLDTSGARTGPTANELTDVPKTETMGSSSAPPSSTQASTQDAATEAEDQVITSLDLTGTEAVPDECSLPADCVPIETSMFTMPVCCREKTPCGYVLSTTEQTLMDFPDSEQFAETIWDDGCVPRDFVFSRQPGVETRRVAVEGGSDVLVTAECEVRNFWAFSMAGCCLPDNRCGISTDHIGEILGFLLEGQSAPFTAPLCLSAAELNQQLRDSGSLASLAFIPDTAGNCDHAALDEQL